MTRYHKISTKLTLLLFFITAMGAATALTGYEEADRPLAFVQKFKPSVGVENAGTLENIKKRGKPLFNGDTLRTDENGFALVQFMDKSLAKVKPESRLIVEGEVRGKQNTSARIGLEAGEIFLNVTKQGRDNFEVATNTTVASVKGTDFGATSDNFFWVQEGIVELLVSGTGESAELTGGNYGQVLSNGTIETGTLTEDEIEERNEEYSQMEENLEPEIIEIRFVDENGQQRVLKVKVFENENK
ncbi:FecR family protein [Fodinibius halophilus]|uniref:FecR domain-containing protein n=1 Tax=Fodinibius halophilus TaxID=1736908 RepID=A0A6M1SZ29_9BACT|nr:FecR family protein [Fodinibius halophilus]NGP89138.1 FecR domain-containing protein [Fodinibius halophilus]